jgi:hypothetical protein
VISFKAGMTVPPGGFIAKAICFLRGHKRGKRVVYTVGGPESDGEREYQCPRCEVTWLRKIRKVKT